MSAPAAFPTPQPLPDPKTHAIGAGLTLLEPQTRRGEGPGLLVIVDDRACGARIENGIPSPLMKWAEEGFCVVEISKAAWGQGYDPISAAVSALDRVEKRQKGAVGLVCYSESLWKTVAQSLQSSSPVSGAIVYTDAASVSSLTPVSIPLLIQSAGQAGAAPNTAKPSRKVYSYADQTTYAFATPFHEGFNYAHEAVSHTRNLTFIKPHTNGPYFDLETIWDEHTYWEFENRSVENTMNTMVAEPYVNHIPTLTGGIGRRELTDFYTNHFIFSNPDDAALELISRTVGIDRIVDELVFKLTHDKVVDWLLPGVPPTGKYIEFALMAVVNIRGDRLYHEHITWDSATVLKQVGLIPDDVPVPQSSSAVGGAKTNGHSSSTQILRLPVGGAETVAKMREKNSVPSNEMFGWGVRDQ